jgi:hypothetical protein
LTRSRMGWYAEETTCEMESSRRLIESAVAPKGARAVGGVLDQGVEA